MDNFMTMTKKAGHTAELQRLADLHAAYHDAMGGNLILAPINLQDSGKRILDCGTADGTWLRSVRDSLPAPTPNQPKPQHHYFGSDIEPELFPAHPDTDTDTDGITFFAHSFTSSSWPSHLLNSFDLVHLRGSLAGASPQRPASVVKNLAGLAKPGRGPGPGGGGGGWVQLMEMNAFSPPPHNGPAMTDFARMASEVWTGIGVGDFANRLKGMLEEAGLRNVGEKRILVEIGKRAKPELRDKSVNGVAGPVAPLAAVARSVKSSFEEEELKGLQERVRRELEGEGGSVEMIVAWGQRA